MLFSHRRIAPERSDGDPISHALVDALLAAMGKGDIADWFSDTDGVTNARSIEYLGKLHESILNQQKTTIIQIQIHILAEEPKLKPYFEQMKYEIAKQLNIEPDQINIQGKTVPLPNCKLSHFFLRKTLL